MTLDGPESQGSKCLNIPCDYSGSSISLSSEENTFCAKKQRYSTLLRREFKRFPQRVRENWTEVEGDRNSHACVVEISL